MKQILKPILRAYLKYITKLVLFIHRPKIIAISGSTSKSFFKSEIKNRLGQKKLGVRANEKSYNTDIGLPLAILSIPSGYGSFGDWLPAMRMAFGRIFKADFPGYLVLELGVSRPGDMKYLLSIIKPDISVITDITQRYLEGFSDMDELVGEYEYLACHTKKGGVVILNGDNQRLRSIVQKIKNAKVIFFGKKDGTDCQICDIMKGETGQSIVIERNSKREEYKMNKFGEHHAFALAAALAVEDHIK